MWQLIAKHEGHSLFSDAFSFGAYEQRNFVQWVNESEALALDLFGVADDGVAWIRADNSSVAAPDGPGRKAVRLVSRDSFSSGVWALDVNRMPEGCGSHYAWWLAGPSWPGGGEIDVVECINGDSHARTTLHTCDDCDMKDDDGFSGHWNSPSPRFCNVSHDHNAGCQIASSDAASCGAAFNRLGSGGVYVTQLVQGPEMKQAGQIASWFFRRGDVPADLSAGTPTPSAWRKPDARFPLGARCNASHFHPLRLILSINFCGWAGNSNEWSQTKAGAAACSTSTGCSTCEEWVGLHPDMATPVRWDVNSLSVYQWQAAAEVEAAQVEAVVAEVEDEVMVMMEEGEDVVAVGAKHRRLVYSFAGPPPPLPSPPPPAAAGPLVLPSILGSHMVLQRAPLAARVWGWAAAATLVNVTLDGAVVGSTVASSAEGAWAVDLPAQKASIGRTLAVSDSHGNQVSLSDVAFGDVYMCSGQSNMEMSVNQVFDASAELAASAKYANLRLYTVADTAADTPRVDAPSKTPYRWSRSQPAAFEALESEGGDIFSYFSAACFFFGREL